MIYTKLTRKAIRLCFEAHREQTDKSGMPYVFHPFHVAESMTDECSTVVALLHDVIEDTDITKEDLSRMGFPTEAVDALCLMTHSKDDDYFDYVARIKENDVARRVKISDLKHNLDGSRKDSFDERDIARSKKYIRALTYLLGEDNIHKFTLHPEPFSLIADGKKTVEMRLYDEKRRRVKIGDVIKFTERDSRDELFAEVIALHVFDSFKTLYANLSLQKCGYTEENISTASPSDMDIYDSSDEQNSYGVVGIEIKLLGYKNER